jgi:hypothetical protein
MVQALGESLPDEKGVRPVAHAPRDPLRPMSAGFEHLEAPVEAHLYICGVLTCSHGRGYNRAILK